jgi:hypothetical protein
MEPERGKIMTRLQDIKRFYELMDPLKLKVGVNVNVKLTHLLM